MANRTNPNTSENHQILSRKGRKMEKKITLIAVLAFGAGVFGIAALAKAAPVTISYEGVITSVSYPEGKLDGSVVVGGTFSGQYTFESTQWDESSHPRFGQYRFFEKAPAGMTMSVTVGNYTFETSSTSAHSEIWVDDCAASEADHYKVWSTSLSQTAGPALQLDETSIGSFIDFGLRTRENLSTLTSDALPLSMPDLAKFEDRNKFSLSLEFEPLDFAAVRGYLAISVPNVVGNSLSAAQSAITSAGYVVGTTSGTYTDTIPAAQVISQDPPAGTLAAPGSAVDLVISLGPADVPSEPEACCSADGSCQDLTPEECIAQGGTPQGAGTTCATTDCPQPPVTGLVAHYKLDETSGTTAVDSSGNGIDGTLMGEPTWQPAGGILDGALLFDGVDDYVDCGRFNPSKRTGQLSICLWANWNGRNGRWQGLIGKRDTAAQDDMMWQLVAHKVNGTLFFGLAGTWVETPEAALPLHEWVHIA
ncbi:MAG: PASTA domain-containing protein, partial [Phycisphaerales bacterium]